MIETSNVVVVMEIHLSRRRTLSERQRRKKILDPSNLNQTFNGKKDIYEPDLNHYKSRFRSILFLGFKKLTTFLEQKNLNNIGQIF